MSNLKKIFFNNDTYIIRSELTLFELIKYFNYSNLFFILEYNHKICDKKDWNKIYLQENDKIEIFTIVGGG